MDDFVFDPTDGGSAAVISTTAAVDNQVASDAIRETPPEIPLSSLPLPAPSSSPPRPRKRSGKTIPTATAAANGTKRRAVSVKDAVTTAEPAKPAPKDRKSTRLNSSH